MTILVLSGGGLWSSAGIGVAAALNDMDIAVDGYVGSSAGALVGGLLALGHSPEHLHQLVGSLKPADFRPDWAAWLSSLVRGRLPLAVSRQHALWRRVAPYFQEQSWVKLHRPLWVVATSLTRRKPMVYGSLPPTRVDWGYRLHLSWSQQDLDLATAIRASMAVPGLFPPVDNGSGDLLVDGGVVDDYPVDVAAWAGATYIIGLWVDEKPEWTLPARGHAGNIAIAGLTTMIRELSVIRQRQVSIPRTDIRVEIDTGHRVLNRVTDIVEMGYAATKARASEIREVLDHHA